MYVYVCWDHILYMPVYFSSNNSLYSIFANGRNIYLLSSHSCRQPKRSTKSNIGCGVMVEWMKATDRHQRANDLSPTINARQIAVIYMVILNIYIYMCWFHVRFIKRNHTYIICVCFHKEMSMMVYGAEYGWLYKVAYFVASAIFPALTKREPQFKADLAVVCVAKGCWNITFM